MGDFSLNVNPGEFTDSEIIVMLGENGTGKTTFIRLMAGLLTPDSGGTVEYTHSPAHIHACIRDTHTHTNRSSPEYECELQASKDQSQISWHSETAPSH